MGQAKTVDNINLINRKKAQEYLVKYLDDIKLHFNLDDEQIKGLLYQTYLELNDKGVVKRWISVLKSFLP